MEEYKNMYFKLFNGITDILEKNKNEFNVFSMIEDLKKLQRESEEMYVAEQEIRVAR